MIFYLESERVTKDQFDSILSELIDMQENEQKKIEVLITFLDKLNNSIQYQENIEDTQKVINMLENLKKLLDCLRANNSNLENLKSSLHEIFPENYDFSLFNFEEKKGCLEVYNKFANECKNQIKNTNELYNSFMLDYIKDIIVLDPTPSNHDENNQEDEHSFESTYGSNSALLTDNRILLISQIQEMVFLPYYIEDLQKILETNSNYNSIQEIIEKEYILPISRFKNPIISRFKETYSLMRNKENASILDSLDLSLELAFNSLLNPAIITACKNLDELDIYLDYLSNNELDKFKIFEVRYEILPRM